MVSVIRRIFYEMPKNFFLLIWASRQDSILNYKKVVRERDTKFVERELNILGGEIDSLDSMMDHSFIPALLEYDKQSGALDESEMKYLDDKTFNKAVSLRSQMNSDILVNMRRYEKNVPSFLLKEYIEAWHIYQNRLIDFRQKLDEA